RMREAQPMNRGIPVLAVLFSAILAGAPARAEERREGAPPKTAVHRQATTKTHPHPQQGKPQVEQRRQSAPRREQGRPQAQRQTYSPRPPSYPRPGYHPRPAAPQRPAYEPNPARQTTRLPAPPRHEDDQGRHADKGEHRGEKPRGPKPLTDPNRFVRKWTPPPAPDKDDKGGAWTAKPATRPPLHDGIRHFDDPGLVSRLAAARRGESEPGRYYWHHDGGLDYMHVYRGGQHWYGFWAGGAYFWTRYHAGRWWWYDPGAARYVYYSGGNWVWQDPAAPQTVYVYENNTYVQSAVPAADAAPSEPETHYFVSNN